MSDESPKPKTTRKKAAKPVVTDVVIPPWPGISDSALAGLADKLAKAKDSYRVSDMILKVNGDDWRSRHAIAWHLVACGAILPESNANIFEFIAEEPESPPAEVAVALLFRLSKVTKSWFRNGTCLLDGYTLTLDKFVWTTYRRAADLVMAQESKLSKTLRLGLAFVRRRLGESISADDSKAILQQLAKHQASSYGITLNNEVPMIVDGQVVPHRLADLAALRKLALLFGTEEWNDAFLQAALEGDWTYSRNVRDAFVVASTEQIGRLVNRSAIDAGDGLRLLVELIPTRNDSALAWIDAAKTITEQDRFRELLLMGAIDRASKTGEVLPDELDELLGCELLDSSYDGVREPLIEWFSKFPRDRALAKARALLEEDYRYSRAVGILAAHFDEGILRAALEKDLGKNYIGSETLGALGAPALELLEWAYEKTEKSGKRRMHQAILRAMGNAAKTQQFDEKWDRFIDFDQEGGEAIPYYSSSDTKLREAALAGVPEPRKAALLQERAASSLHPDRVLQLAKLVADPSGVIDAAVRKMVERRNLGGNFREIVDNLGEPVIDAICKHIGLSEGDGRFLQSLKAVVSTPMFTRVEEALQSAGIKKETARDALVRMCNRGPEPKLRTYVLQVYKEDYEAKPGTLSRTGGEPPGLAEDDYPKDASGEPLTYLFTLDLDEIPELKSMYGGARAIAAFCPEPNSGDRTDEFMFVPISQESVANLPPPSDDDDGEPIAIQGLDVPLGVFETSSDESLAAIRKMIFNASGHVFGEPFWIQDGEGGGNFVMQINEGLSSMNLGDSGSLYVFDWGTVFQCY